jgi:hypothetical protein
MVRGLGLLLALLGVITVIMGVTITTGSSWINDLMPAEDDERDDTALAAQEEFAADVAGLGNMLEFGIYIFGIYMLVQGLMAVFCCGKKYQGNCLCVGLFQIFQIALFLLTLVIAIVPAGMYMISEENLEWFCAQSESSLNTFWSQDGETPSPVEEMIAKARGFVAQADESITARSGLMCVNDCGCYVNDFSAWPTVGADWVTGPVTNWADCNTILEALPEEGSRSVKGQPEAFKQLQAYFDNILMVLETDFDCQGICTSGDFFLFDAVSRGAPERACLSAMKDDFSGSSFAGMIVMFVTCVVDLLLFICMFKQCKKDDSE